MDQVPQVQHVHIWIKAFIGSVHPSLPDYITRTDANTYVIKAPVTPPMPGLDIAALSGTCFETDNRLFSDDPLASARVTVDLMLTIKNRTELSVTNTLTTGVSRNVNCKTGIPLRADQHADKSKMWVGTVRQHNFINVFGIDISASDPFYKVMNVGVAPNLNFELVFEHQILHEAIVVKGTCDNFPWYEAYYSIDSEAKKVLFQLPPEKESTVLSLMGKGKLLSRNVTATIHLPPPRNR